MYLYWDYYYVFVIIGLKLYGVSFLGGGGAYDTVRILFLLYYIKFIYQLITVTVDLGHMSEVAVSALSIVNLNYFLPFHTDFFERMSLGADHYINRWSCSSFHPGILQPPKYIFLNLIQ